MKNLDQFIESEILSLIENSNKSTKYRKGLVGFADAQNPKFYELKQLIGKHHLLPSDLLPNAKSVVSFFIPFTEDLVKNNKAGEYASRDWALAYKETNILINEIIEHMRTKLNLLGIDASTNPAKTDFDREILMHQWSQRHVAQICGLGSFGINNMLITKLGCAGRYGSFVINKELPFNEPIAEEYCLWKIDKSCGACVNVCPVNAISGNGFERYICYNRLKEEKNHFDDLGNTEVCGKCIAVPCAFKIPYNKER